MNGGGVWIDDYPLLGGGPDVNGCTVRARSEGTQWGNAEDVTQVLTSMMRDGDRVTGIRSGNRKPTIAVKIEGPSLDAVAATERDLARRCGRPAVVRWQPPDVTAAECVFDVVWSRLDHKMDDFGETQKRRYFSLELDALPFARDADLTVLPAVATPTEAAVTTVVDPGTSTTGWSTSVGTTLTSAGGAIVGSRTSTGGLVEIPLNRTGTFAMTGTPWLSVDVQLDDARMFYGYASGTSTAGILINDAQTILHPVSVLALSPGVKRYYYYAGTASITKVFTVARAYMPAGDVAGFRVLDISRTNRPPGLGGGRQLHQMIAVGGSARTQGSIHVAHTSPTGQLGEVMVYTYPWTSKFLGYRPPASPYFSDGETQTVDATNVSGGYRGINGAAANYYYPAEALPTGSYTVLARLRTAAGAAYNHRVNCVYDCWQGGNQIGPKIIEQPVVRLESAVWTTVILGQVTLPPTRLGPAGLVRVSLQRDPGDVPTLQLDEVWLCHDEGSLTLLTYAGPHVWIDAPSLDEPAGALFVGTAIDRDDQWHGQSQAAAMSPEHTFDPEGTQVFTMTSGAVNAPVDLTFFRRHHTHVAAAG